MREIFPVVVVLFVLLLITAAVASVVVWLMPERLAGTRLTYQVDVQSGSDPAAVDMKAIKEAVERRVNPGFSRDNAEIELVGNRRIEVGIFDDDPDEVERIQRLLAIVGKLEFHILANRSVDQDLIEKAQKPRGLDEVRSEGGDVLGKWVPVQPDQESAFPPSPGTRPRSKGPRSSGTLEVLVVAGGFDDAHDYLEKAEARTEAGDQHVVNLVFNGEGAKRFRELIAPNSLSFAMSRVPDGTRRLGVVLDGRLWTAMEIEFPNYQRVQITGPFTRQDVEVLAAVLSAGPLPAGLRRVKSSTSRLQP